MSLRAITANSPLEELRRKLHAVRKIVELTAEEGVSKEMRDAWLRHEAELESAIRIVEAEGDGK